MDSAKLGNPHGKKYSTWQKVLHVAGDCVRVLHVAVPATTSRLTQLLKRTRRMELVSNSILTSAGLLFKIVKICQQLIIANVIYFIS